jgi:hypothetical protein
MKYNYNKGMKSAPLYLIMALCILTGLLSCSRAEPRILYGFLELVYYPGKVKPEERFSFFVLPDDDDGIENLSELYLYHDREGLRWDIDSSDWIKLEEEGKIWVGSRNIAMYGDELLPRGQYRAVLVNKGGESSERKFTFDGPEEAPHKFPSLLVNEGVYRIESQYPVNRFICYDQQGNAVQIITLPALEGYLRDLRITSSARTLALWAENPEYRISALTEAALIR